MKIIELKDAIAYEAPKHFDVKSLKLTDEAAGFCQMGVSYYLPGGGAHMDSSPFEKVYLALDGEITVENGDGEIRVLKPMDSCVIAANEKREVRNETNRTATLLVVMPKT